MSRSEKLQARNSSIESDKEAGDVSGDEKASLKESDNTSLTKTVCII